MKPILFNTEMVRAILDGRKTTTRRVIKGIPESYTELQGIVTSTTGADKLIGSYMFGLGCQCVYKKPPYQKGDVLYVRETWQCFNPYSDKEYVYKATNDCSDVINMKWIPSIHMPKEAARIFLKVTGVRVERLREITEEQAAKEGASKIGGTLDFKMIWEDTLKKDSSYLYGWSANPWVWVIEFERCEKAGDTP